MENEQQKYQGQVTEVCTNDGAQSFSLFVLGSRLSPLPELAICSARGQRWNLAPAARVRLLPLACVAALFLWGANVRAWTAMRLDPHPLVVFDGEPSSDRDDDGSDGSDGDGSDGPKPAVVSSRRSFNAGAPPREAA